MILVELERIDLAMDMVYHELAQRIGRIIDGIIRRLLHTISLVPEFEKCIRNTCFSIKLSYNSHN